MFVALVLLASAPLDVVPGPPPTSLAPFVEVQLDEGGALDWDRAARGKFEDAPVTPGPSGVLWARARLHNATHTPIDLWIFSGDETVWRFDARLDDGPIERSGRAVPGHERSVDTRKPTVSLKLPPGEHVLLARLEARTSAAKVALTLGAPEHLSVVLDRETLLLGVMYGALAIMMIYGLFLAVLVREKIYALYAAFIASVIPWLAYTDGTLHQLGVTGVTVDASQRMFALTSHGVTILMILFARSVVETQRLRRTDLTLRTLGWLTAAVFAWGVIAPSFAHMMAFAVVSLVSLVVVMVASVRRWRAGWSPAGYYLLGWLMLFAVMAPLAVLQLGGSGGLPIWSWGLGFVVEISFAAAAIAELTRLANQRVRDLNRAGGRFVPFEFLKLLGREDLTEVTRGDHSEQNMSVFFSDIRAFTTLVEGRTPQENFAFINEYLGWMEPSITGNGGFIDSYEGDAIMALFSGGPPDAVRAAVGNLEALKKYNVERAAKGQIEIRIGIGIHSGGLMLGTIGGTDRIKCGVIGDPANTASRVEGMTKRYGAMLLISGETLDALDDGLRAELQTRELDSVVAKGKHKPITVHEVLTGLPEAELQRKLDARADYAAGLAAYRAGELEDARAAFARCPDDAAAEVMLDNLAVLEAEGLPEGWDGVWRLTSK